MNTIILPPGNRGRNKRGICAHKRTKGARITGNQLQTGYAPNEVSAYRMSLAKVKGTIR